MILKKPCAFAYTGVVGVISFFFIQDLATEFGMEKGREMIESRSGMTDEQKAEAIASMEDRSGSSIGGYISSFLGGTDCFIIYGTHCTHRRKYIYGRLS